MLSSTLMGLAALLAGCGGGGGDTPTPAPTPPAPTAKPTPVPTAPTPAPTLPPTDGWAKVACAWETNNKDGSHQLILQEAGCQDEQKQLKMHVISVNKLAGIPLAPTETCQMATDGFLNSVCADGEVSQKNETYGECILVRSNVSDTTDVQSTTCDKAGKKKYFVYKSTTQTYAPYADDRDCTFTMNAWKVGLEKVHPGGCGSPGEIEAKFIV